MMEHIAMVFSKAGRVAKVVEDEQNVQTTGHLCVLSLIVLLVEPIIVAGSIVTLTEESENVVSFKLGYLFYVGFFPCNINWIAKDKVDN